MNKYTKELKEIFARTCEVLNIREDFVKSKGRKAEEVFARWCFFYIAENQLGKSSGKITHCSISEMAHFVNRNHATALFALGKIKEIPSERTRINKFLELYSSSIHEPENTENINIADIRKSLIDFANFIKNKPITASAEELLSEWEESINGS